MKLAYVAATISVAPPTTRSTRRQRGPWSPSSAGSYRLPRKVEAIILPALTEFRNRDAALALAVYLGRHWTLPRNLGIGFPVDRRAMAERSSVDLTEARVRGALHVLEEIGFIERQPITRSSAYRATEHGLRRKPVIWRFTAAFLALFEQANRAAVTRRAAASRPTPATQVRTPVAVVAQKENPVRMNILMGEEPIRPERTPLPSQPETALEAALARWGAQIGKVE